MCPPTFTVLRRTPKLSLHARSDPWHFVHCAQRPFKHLNQARVAHVSFDHQSEVRPTGGATELKEDLNFNS
jgi:hypothetical protein